MARHLFLVAALLLVAFSLTATPASAHSAIGLADDAGYTSWSSRILNVTGGWKMLSDMRGTAFVPSNDAWRWALVGYQNNTSPVDPATNETLTTIVSTRASEASLLAMSDGAWSVLMNLAHYHLTMEGVNATFIKLNLTEGIYRLTSHKTVPIYLTYNNVTKMTYVTGKTPAKNIITLAVPVDTAHANSHAEVLPAAAAAPAPLPTVPAPVPTVAAPKDLNGTVGAVALVVVPDVVDGHGYVIHAINSVLFPDSATTLSEFHAKPPPPAAAPPPPPKSGASVLFNVVSTLMAVAIASMILV